MIQEGTAYVKARSKRKKATKGREVIPYGRIKVTRLALIPRTSTGRIGIQPRLLHL